MIDRVDRRTVYSAVASRRIQYGSQTWQVPGLSIAAQAFLFSVALSSDSTQIARTICGGLSIAVAFLSVLLMARNRIADWVDADWLELQESGLDDDLHAHGDPWIARRTILVKSGRLRGFMRIIPQWNAFDTWVVGLMAFAVAALAIIVITWEWPWMLDPNWK